MGLIVGAVGLVRLERHMESTYLPLTASTWPSFETVMGCDQGGNGGCWCTWWRLARGEWERQGRAGRKSYFRHIVENGQPTGIIGLRDGSPYGWCAVAPVQDYPVIGRSPVARPSLRDGDWFISCFFVEARYRRSGALLDLLTHAIDFAQSHGALAIEACPRDSPAGSGISDLFVGKTSVFLGLGFVEVHRQRHDRPLLRLEL